MSDFELGFGCYMFRNFSRLLNPSQAHIHLGGTEWAHDPQRKITLTVLQNLSWKDQNREERSLT